MGEQTVGGKPESKVESGPKPKKDSKVVIAVLGVTGAGKSTFINAAYGDNVMKISHGSQPCTQVPQKVEFRMGDRTIVLIDTPGFDDDKRSDVRILEDIATWLARNGYLSEQMLDGLIFLHPITLTRAGGSELDRTQLLERILGPNAYNRVFIATTMWDYIVSEDLVKDRLNSRFEAGGVWHELRGNGAKYVKHYNTKDSARSIISDIIAITDREGKPKTLLETELKETKGHVIKTSAGGELKRQIEKRITVLDEEMQKHRQKRPLESYKNDKNSEHRKEWKRWHTQQRKLQGRLDHEKKELRKLQNVVVRFIQFLASLFMPSR